MVALDHVFDDHFLCDSKWYYKKHIEDEKILVDEKTERVKEGNYRCNMKDKELYKKLVNKY